MKHGTNVVPFSEFIRLIPHPVIIDSLINKYPVVISKVEGISQKRKHLGKIIPKIQYIETKEYGYHTGLLKNDNLIHTHVNPIID